MYMFIDKNIFEICGQNVNFLGAYMYKYVSSL